MSQPRILANESIAFGQNAETRSSLDLSLSHRSSYWSALEKAAVTNIVHELIAGL
ncbi:hypothetical protein DACRYDRAFT_24069 [Dacryopinax primogenitus]|uniref:Uncharacterized protein n=1 Tax=Dacryopinax primogenitus (strain DJM 731) TaxID=1858805 RepID=M5FU00_DACPD|nr:uncharacterized protein DACRYDRAFT_24069 [Dacryopinax primogenitus]EJT98959.1 hypothetical protein DACRYDRAFT_24069 [Dacryopinax primogenitus]